MSVNRSWRDGRCNHLSVKQATRISKVPARDITYQSTVRIVTIKVHILSFLSILRDTIQWNYSDVPFDVIILMAAVLFYLKIRNGTTYLTISFLSQMLRIISRNTLPYKNLHFELYCRNKNISHIFVKKSPGSINTKHICKPCVAFDD